MVKIYRVKLAGLALSIVTLAAHACASSGNLPPEIKLILFERNSGVIASKDIVDLASWAIDMKNKYPLRQWMTIGGTSAPDEKKPSELAAGRAAAAKNLMTQFELAPSSVEVKSYVDTSYMKEMNGNMAMSVQIELVPGCPNNCCD